MKFGLGYSKTGFHIGLRQLHWLRDNTDVTFTN